MFKFILPKCNFRWERWKWNSEYRVYVSSLGNFKNEYKQNLPVKINQGGYVTIKTCAGLVLAHRLVMLTFKPIPNREAMTVDHLNHNKRDNSLANLEWVTRAENQRRAKVDYCGNQGIDEDLAGKIIARSLDKKEVKWIFNSWEDAYEFVNVKNCPFGTFVKRAKNKMSYCNYKWEEK